MLELPSPEGFDVVQPGTDELEFNIPDSPESIYADALNIKPAIKTEEIRLEQAGKNVDVAKSGFYPTLSLSAGAGTSYYTSSNFATDPMGDQLKNNFGPHIGLNLSIPIFSRNSNRNNVRSAQLSQLNQELQLDNAKKTLYKEIQQGILLRLVSLHLQLQAILLLELLFLLRLLALLELLHLQV